MIKIWVCVLGLLAVGFAEEIDYHSHPQYSFEYGVNDPHTHDVKKQWETRNGDKVTGSYSLKEADGTIRIVNYEANDRTGFNAVVRREGHAIHPTFEHKEHHPIEQIHHNIGVARSIIHQEMRPNIHRDETILHESPVTILKKTHPKEHHEISVLSETVGEHPVRHHKQAKIPVVHHSSEIGAQHHEPIHSEVTVHKELHPVSEMKIHTEIHGEEEVHHDAEKKVHLIERHHPEMILKEIHPVVHHEEVAVHETVSSRPEIAIHEEVHHEKVHHHPTVSTIPEMILKKEIHPVVHHEQITVHETVSSRPEIAIHEEVDHHEKVHHHPTVSTIPEMILKKEIHPVVHHEQITVHETVSSRPEIAIHEEVDHHEKVHHHPTVSTIPEMILKKEIHPVVHHEQVIVHETPITIHEEGHHEEVAHTAGVKQVLTTEIV